MIFKKSFSTYYLSSNAIQLIGNGMHFIAVNWLIFTLSNSVYYIGVTMSVCFLARIISSTILLKYIDKINAIQINILTGYIRCVVTLFPVILSSFFTDQKILIVLILVEIINAFIASVYTITTNVIIKYQLNNVTILEFLRKKELITQVCLVLGGIFAGIIMDVSSAYTVISINALGYLISAILLKLMYAVIKINQHHLIEYKEKKTEKITNKTTINCVTKYLIAISIISAVPALAFDAVAADFVKHHLYSNGTIYGFLDASYSFGAVLAGLLLIKMNFLCGKIKLIIIFQFILGLFCIGLSQSHSIMLSIAISLVLGYIGIYLKIIVNAEIQINNHTSLIGKIQSLATIFQNSFALLTLLLTSFFAKCFSASLTLLIIGTLIILITIILQLIKSILHRGDI